MNFSSKNEVFLSARSGIAVRACSSTETLVVSDSRVGDFRRCKTYVEKVISFIYMSFRPSLFFHVF